MSVWKELVKEKIGQWKSKGKTKIFCIGRNKTGTTSIKKALEQNGFVVGNQRKASLLVDDYLKGHSDTIIEYCNSAEAFQDVPFSYPGTYESLDRSFPGSKFILSVRESSEIWYESFVRFHSKRFGMGSIPTKDTLLNSQYIYKGWIWKSYVSQFGCDHKLYWLFRSDYASHFGVTMPL